MPGAAAPTQLPAHAAEELRDQARNRELDALAEAISASTSEAELADPDAGETRVDRAINKTAEAIGAVLLTAMAALAFLNAVGRYAFATPIPATEEVVAAMLPWLAIIGLFLSCRRRELIRFEGIAHLLPPQPRRILEMLLQLIGTVCFAYFTLISFDYFQLFGNDKTLYLSMPKGYYTSSLFIGGAFISLALLYNVWRAGRRRGADPDGGR